MQHLIFGYIPRSSIYNPLINSLRGQDLTILKSHSQFSSKVRKTLLCYFEATVDEIKINKLHRVVVSFVSNVT